MLEALLHVIENTHPAYILVLVGLITASEYIAPFLPGDTATVIAMALAARADYRVQGVYLAAIAGSSVGAMVAWRMGVWLREHADRQPHWLSDERSQRARRIIENGFERYGAWYLAINRFVPGLRAFFFWFAGMAKMKPFPVLVFGTLSAALWNAVLLLLGFTLGMNFAALSRFFENYTVIVLVLSAIICVVYFAVRRQTNQGSNGT